MDHSAAGENDFLLRIKNLTIGYQLAGQSGKAVDGITFDLKKGECLGLVGESGSGKTTIAKSILKLLPSNAEILEGSIILKNKELVGLNEKEMDRIRWSEVSLVPQSAMNALDPVSRISKQMITTFQAHKNSFKNKKEILEKCQQLLEMVGLNRKRIFDYPHQFSGGMRQRVIIAMAIALDPDLIIADEPTTALDVVMQAQIIDLLKSLTIENGKSIILITHDISIVAEICQKVGVIYCGSLMEYGDIRKVFNEPFHPYTMGLKGAFPTIRDPNKALISIPGSSPMLLERKEGCGFANRCPHALDICKEKKPLASMIEKNHYAACHRIEDAVDFRKSITEVFGAGSRGSRQ